MNATVQRKVLAACLCDASEAEIAANELSKAERIIETLAALERRRTAALANYKREVAEVDGLLARLQEQCEHAATTDEHGMPGEEITRCDLCGLAL